MHAIAESSERDMPPESTAEGEVTAMPRHRAQDCPGGSQVMRSGESLPRLLFPPTVAAITLAKCTVRGSRR
jgi:hypothetical protein